MTTNRPRNRYYSPAQSASYRQKPPKKRHHVLKFFVMVIVLGALVYAGHAYMADNKTTTNHKTTNTTASTSTKTTEATTTASTAKAPNPCAGNTLSQLALVSISKQHLWACQYQTAIYNSPVVTGMELYAADLTPPGTYHIYDKETDINLKGCDSTGCWNDHVSYWMAWLDNQYGEYGFHDATWRNPDEFGKVNIYAPDTAAVVGSHGCVELPLATAKWLYNWTQIGTTVKIDS